MGGARCWRRVCYMDCGASKEAAGPAKALEKPLVKTAEQLVAETAEQHAAAKLAELRRLTPEQQAVAA